MTLHKKLWKKVRDKNPAYYPANNNPVYGIGMIGAAVYYVSQATSFGSGVIGLLKALIWPGFVVHQLMTYLKM